ncbi:hypothetical protein FB451DRAFT_1364647 [Mycena latifolia]|nr:hypothetical protein FB451DRAFT_1364647 [Mycena latifolia]
MNCLIDLFCMARSLEGAKTPISGLFGILLQHLEYIPSPGISVPIELFDNFNKDSCPGPVIYAGADKLADRHRSALLDPGHHCRPLECQWRPTGDVDSRRPGMPTAEPMEATGYHWLCLARNSVGSQRFPPALVRFHWRLCIQEAHLNFFRVPLDSIGSPQSRHRNPAVSAEAQEKWRATYHHYERLLKDFWKHQLWDELRLNLFVSQWMCKMIAKRYAGIPDDIRASVKQQGTMLRTRGKYLSVITRQ